MLNIKTLAIPLALAAALSQPVSAHHGWSEYDSSKELKLTGTIAEVAAHMRAAGRPFGMPGRLADIAAFRALGATFLYYPVEWLFERAMEELKRAVTAPR